MGTIQEHRNHAAHCIARAEMSETEGDKALWLTLAQSWVRLAEHVSRQAEESGQILRSEAGEDLDLAPDLHIFDEVEAEKA
jgi:putative IMPACT (imprinted ancient) family translation regulator